MSNPSQNTFVLPIALKLQAHHDFMAHEKWSGVVWRARPKSRKLGYVCELIPKPPPPPTTTIKMPSYGYYEDYKDDFQKGGSYYEYMY